MVMKTVRMAVASVLMAWLNMIVTAGEILMNEARSSKADSSCGIIQVTV